jgi:integrase
MLLQVRAWDRLKNHRRKRRRIMAIRKREGNREVTWQIDYLDPNGKRVRQSFKKKKDAEAELGKRVSLIAEKRYLDVKKDYTSTFGELIQKYTENFQSQKYFAHTKKYYIPTFKEYFGEHTLLSQIKYIDRETYQNRLRNKLTRWKRIRTVAAVNREMACLGSMLRKAVEWEMMEQSPFDRGKNLRLKENNKRTQFLTEDEIERLLAELKPKKHLYWIVFTALNTGMRRGEILSLKWDQIRNGYIYLSDTKNMEPRQIPVNDALAAMFKEIRKEMHFTSEYVFTWWGGHIIKQVDRGFHAACQRAEIEGVRFHDLRHTFASHLVIRGASLKEVQELLGHKTMTMTLRYAHLAEENKKSAVNLLNGLGTLCQNSHVTNMSQIAKQG